MWTSDNIYHLNCSFLEAVLMLLGGFVVIIAIGMIIKEIDNVTKRDR